MFGLLRRLVFEEGVDLFVGLLVEVLVREDFLFALSMAGDAIGEWRL